MQVLDNCLEPGSALQSCVLSYHAHLATCGRAGTTGLSPGWVCPGLCGLACPAPGPAPSPPRKRNLLAVVRRNILARRVAANIASAQ